MAKHHERGRLTIRERVTRLVDKGSFQEVGTLTGQGKYDGARLTGVQPAPYVMGLANIDGRPRKLLAQPSKQGWLYVFDRITGQPIWPIEEKPMPPSCVL